MPNKNEETINDNWKRGSHDNSGSYLEKETIAQLMNDKNVKSQGYKILARWALNQPTSLLKLEQKGFLVLYTTLVNQQEEEMEALLTNRDASMSEQELLELQGINTSLLISD